MPDPSSRIDDLIAITREMAGAQADLADRAAAVIQELGVREVFPHAEDGTPQPPDVFLFRGTNAELPPAHLLLAGVTAQLTLAFFNTPMPALDGLTPLQVLRLVRS